MIKLLNVISTCFIKLTSLGDNCNSYNYPLIMPTWFAKCVLKRHITILAISLRVCQKVPLCNYYSCYYVFESHSNSKQKVWFVTVYLLFQKFVQFRVYLIHYEISDDVTIKIIYLHKNVWQCIAITSVKNSIITTQIFLPIHHNMYMVMVTLKTNKTGKIFPMRQLIHIRYF